MTDLVTVTKPISRDRFGRPLVVPPDGGKPVPYTRATTVAETTDDRFNLEKWKVRMAAKGIADRPDLLLAVTAHADDKRELDKICDKAIEAAKASAAATTGTALHALSEVVDRGEDLPVLPDSARADLEAYRQAVTPFGIVAIEQFLVVDDHQIGGTADRIVELDGRRYIFDLKTGSTVKFSMGAIAQQLSIYSRGVAYDIDTTERTPINVDQDRAIVAHLPSGSGQCSLYWVDIANGWEAVQISLRVRAYRKYAKKELLFTPLEADAA